MIIKYFKILKNKNFFLLWFGQIISQFGDRLAQIALIGLVSQNTMSSSKLAFVMSLSIIPVFVISPISGVYIDRWSKRKTMYLSDLLRGIFVLLIPVFLLKGNSLIAIYILIFLSFSAGRFFIPAKMAFIPQIINDKKEIFLANSLISMTATIAAILGFGLGGIIVENHGTSAAFTLDAITFLISALCIILITLVEKSKFMVEDVINLGKNTFSNVKKSFAQEFSEGLKYIFSSAETKYAFKIFFFLFSYIGGLYVVFIRFIQEVLSTITKDLGLMTVSLGSGIFIGLLIYGRIAHKFTIKKVLNMSILVSSGYLIFFATTLKACPNTMYGIFLAFIFGLLISPVFVGVNSLIHQQSDKKLLGRIFSGLEFISHLGFLISMFICSFLADIFTPFTIVISIGIIGLSIAILFTFKND